MTSKCLNIGCDIWKIPKFINIDLNPKVNPDMLLDLTKLENSFEQNSIDFIYAGHILEHFKSADSQSVLDQCYRVLKPFRAILAVVPDWRKAIAENDMSAENIILADGTHQMLMSSERLHQMLKKSGFNMVQEITELNQIPYLIVPDTTNPKAELWQSALIAFKF